MNKTKTILRLALKTAELYQDGGWRSLSIAGTHDGAFSVKLADGRYMVGGGFSKQGGVGQSAATDIYDPQTHAFSTGPQLTQARAQAKAVGTGTLVYVSGNWYTADKVMDCYNGSSFQAVGDMDGRSNPYMMADAEGNLLLFSAYDTEGRSFGFHTYDDGSTGLLADRYLASTGQTKYLGLPFTPQICPTALPDDMRSEDYHVIFNGHNCYLILAESPKTTFSGKQLVIRTVKTTATYERKDVLRYTYENAVYLGIDLQPGERRVQMNREGDQITFRGLQAGSTASVYAVNGTLIEQRKVVDDQSFTIRSKPNEDRGEKYIDFTLLAEPGDRLSGDGPTLQLELNGMIQTGMMWPVFVEDEPYMDRILDFAIGYAVYAGPKITGNLTFDALKGGGDLYSALNKSKLTGSYFTIDAEASVKYRAWRGHTVEKKYPQSLSMYSIDYNLFPEISNMTYEVTGNEMNEIKAHFYTKGETFWPQYLGVALYAKANDNDEKYTKLYKNALKYETYFLLNNYNDAEVEIKNIDAGDYKLRPIIKLKGFDAIIPIYDMEQDVHIGRTDLLLQPDKLTVEEEGGEFTIGLKTGHPLPVEVMPNMDWATAKVNYVDDANGRWARSITVTVDPNDDNGRVSITLGGNYTFSDIQVSKADQEWLTVEQHSDYFIINAIPNTSDQERETTITLVFKKVNVSKPGPETYKVSFKIKQKAAIAKVDKDRLHFFGNGGSDQVKIDFGIYPYCGAYVSGKADPEDHEMVKMPVAIVQDGSTIIPDGDGSPFKMVNFWMTRKIDYVVDGDEGNVGTTELNQQFTFYPNNSHFTLKREKGYIHVECEGLAENSTNGKTKASLKFDIYGSDKTVRNLQFRSDTHATTSVYMMGYQATMTSDVEVKVATGSLPLSTYTATYMECPKYKVSDSLVFTSISGTGHSVATCVPYAEMSIIISGRLTGQTISDLYFAILKTDSPGVHCIMKDYDGTSAKTTWSPPADN